MLITANSLMSNTQTNAASLAYELARDLRDSEGVRTQNFKNLASNKDKQITDYCALGALACERGFIHTAKGDGNSFHPNKWIIKEPPYEAIIQAYGLRDKLKRPAIISWLINRKTKSSITTANETSLSSLIVTLNDQGHWKFNEIARLIERLAVAGHFTTCSAKVRKASEQYKLVENCTEA